MSTNYEETRLQIAVCDYLRGIRRVKNKEYPSKTPFPQLLFTHPANQGRSPQEGAKLKKMGVRAGVPDLLFWWIPDFLDGNNKIHYGLLPIQSAAIELKSKTGSSSTSQKKFRESFERMGGAYAICKSVKEVRDTIISWGIKCENTFCEEPPSTWEEKIKAVHEMYKRHD